MVSAHDILRNGFSHVVLNTFKLKNRNEIPGIN